MVATATASGIRPAAASTAAPPRLCPMTIFGAVPRPRRWSAAATKSSTLDEKLVLANSPSLWPKPVKSKRKTAIPREARPAAMREAAKMSLVQVKQWAKRATARLRPRGFSKRAASCWPPAPAKVSFSLVTVIMPPLALVRTTDPRPMPAQTGRTRQHGLVTLS